MSYDNPTPLRVGATGALNGWRVRVAGRIVMGMEDGGETYYWNEFFLLDDGGNSATLVFEETEHGAEWKLFREFTPSQPLTVREAASKRVGDMVDLDGSPTRITLVDQSRVCHIEGEAPEGMEPGDVASYFNADTGSRMLVASWTGDEIEFYEGLDAPAESVAAAFNLPRDRMTGTARPAALATRDFEERPSGGMSRFSRIALFLFLGLALFSAYSFFKGGVNIPSFGRSGPKPKIAAPPLQLQPGASGSLAQHSYIIYGRALVEVARVIGRHDRREYQLRDEANEHALLVNALSGGAKEWHLFRPAKVPADLNPFDAATKKKGAPINIEGRTLRITDLFQSKATTADGPEGNRALPGAVQYGFVANEAGDWLIARWSESQIQLLRGTAIPEAEVLAALNRPATTK